MGWCPSPAAQPRPWTRSPPGAPPAVHLGSPDVARGAGQQPPHARVAEELEAPPHVRGRRARVREGREIAPDAAVLVEDGEDFPRVLHRRPDLRLVADHAAVVFYGRYLGGRHRGDLRRVEAVERLPDAVPLGLDDAPADPGLEN